MFYFLLLKNLYVLFNMVNMRKEKEKEMLNKQ